MDRATRNLAALIAIGLTFCAYGFCAVIAYGVLPLFEGRIADVGIGLLALIFLCAVLGVSTSRFLGTLMRERRATRRLSRRIEATAMTSPRILRRAARETGLDGRVTLIDSPDCDSFVYGTLTPKVAISRGLLELLSAEELRATMTHERHHVESLDPLRSMLAGAVSDALFFLPGLCVLRDRYEAARELAADRRAAALCGTRPLAGALLKAIEGRAAGRPGTIPLAGPDLIDARLLQLETGDEPRLTGIDGRVLALSVLGSSAFLVLLASAPLGAGGDLGRAISGEFGPRSLFEGGLFCLVPVALSAALLHRRISSRSAPPWRRRGRERGLPTRT